MKVGAFIPVRLASERLPGKALRELSGRPVIFHLLDRVCACRFVGDPKDVIVCTTITSSDDPLVSAVESYGCSVFRGAVDDIIDRFNDAMQAFPLDFVIQANGDNPLSAIEAMDKTVSHLVENQDVDVATISGLPLGTSTHAFTRRALNTVVDAYETCRNDTGFFYYFTRTGLCKHVELENSDINCRLPEARLTLDYEEDLEMFEAIFSELQRPGELIGLAEVVQFLRGHKDVLGLNSHLDTDYWTRTSEKAQLEFRAPSGEKRKIAT